MPENARKELKAKIADLGLSIPSVFADFNGQILEDFLGTSTVMAAAQGKADAASKIKSKLPIAVGSKGAK